MEELIEQIAAKFGANRFIYGGCGAFATVLCEQAIAQGLPWKLVVVDHENDMWDSDDPDTEERIVSHVMAEIDGVIYDSTGKASVDDWIASVVDQMGWDYGKLDWATVELDDASPLELLTALEKRYCFNEDQLKLHKQLTKYVEEFTYVPTARLARSASHVPV